MENDIGFYARQLTLLIERISDKVDALSAKDGALEWNHAVRVITIMLRNAHPLGPLWKDMFLSPLLNKLNSYSFKSVTDLELFKAEFPLEMHVQCSKLWVAMRGQEY